MTAVNPANHLSLISALSFLLSYAVPCLPAQNHHSGANSEEVVTFRQHPSTSPQSAASRGEKQETLQNHHNFHRETADTSQTAGEHPKTVSLLSLRSGISSMECGAVYTLEEDGERTKLTQDFNSGGKNLIPIPDRDCERVEKAIQNFYTILFDYRKGPERFSPILASEIQTNVFEDLPETQLTKSQKSRLLASLLDGLFYVMLTEFEGIELADDPEEPEALSAVQLEQIYKRQAASIRETCRRLGLLGRRHLAAIQPLISHWRTLIDAHQVKRQDAADAEYTILYHFQWNIASFAFAWQEHRLKLVSIHWTT